MRTGYYEGDFRRKAYYADGRDLRLHVSFGVTKKDDAKTLAAAVGRLVDGKHLDLLDLLRAGTITARQVADHLAEEKPIGLLRATAPVVPLELPWPSVRASADAMLAWITENPNKSAGTHLAARARYNRFCAFLDARRDLVPLGAETALDAVPTSVLEAYQSAMLAEGAETNTVTAYIAQIGALYRWQQRREARSAREEKRAARVLHVPLDPETVAKGTSRRDRYLTEPEAERLFEACPAPLRFVVACGLFAGLRIEETLHLRPEFDVDLALGLIVVQPQPTWTPKTKKRREIPIAPDLRPILEAHLEHFASEDWFMPAATDPTRPMKSDVWTPLFKRVVTDAELVYGRKPKKGVVYHTLRHTFASWLIMRGVDLYTVAQLLGNSLAMVEHTYGHLAPDFRQRAVDRLAGAIRMPTASSAAPSSTPADVPPSATTTATDDA